jgi:hypothetical protein
VPPVRFFEPEEPGENLNFEILKSPHPWKFTKMDLDLENSLALKGLEVPEEVEDSHEHENPVQNLLDYSSSDDNGSDDNIDDNVDDNVVDDNADNVSTTPNLEITSPQQEGTDLYFRRTSLSKSYLERPGLTRSSFSTYKTIQIPVNTATGGGGLTAYFAVALHTDSQPTTLFLENADIFQEDFIFMASIESGTDLLFLFIKATWLEKCPEESEGIEVLKTVEGNNA